MNTLFLERTANGLPIPAFAFGHAGPAVLILGGVHGDEREGIELAYGAIDRWRHAFAHPLRVTVVPMFNLDGTLRNERRNARGVDLNRNLPTKDWSPVIATERYHPGASAGSEPETAVLVDLIARTSPSFIFSLHSFRQPMLNVNGDCGAVAEAAARVSGYAVESTIGYPTPGCLGTYAGLERGIPTLTYELERGMPTAPILKTHVPALDAALTALAAKGSE